jgi:hypothetical protein
MHSPTCFLALCSLALPTLAAEPSVADKAQAVLAARCVSCHGKDGSAKGGFGYALDRERLIARGKVVPGRAADSELFQRVRDGEMPPAGRPQLTAAERDALQAWIEGGAPPFVAVGPAPTFVTTGDLQRLVLADLQALEPRQRRFMRYLNLTHLRNARLPDDELDKERHALAKLVNSLSWHPRLTRPTPIDAAATLYRLDLRDYRWPARAWDRLATTYPFRLGEEGEAFRTAAELTGSERPLLRADWFLATASRPPFYHDFLQLPTTDRALERLLLVDVPGDVQDDACVRAGFNGSGVSRNNRVLERHDAAHGAYWRSYDFSDNTDRQNLFQRPLGFIPAGGEIIFNLPNGLQAYMLVDGNGRRIDKAPGDIVSDPKRPDRLVENGLSCISCHAKGLMPKDDQVRAHVQKNRVAFAAADRDAILALYVPPARFRNLLTRDAERFTGALQRLGVAVLEPEQVETAVLRFEAVLDLPVAAAEAGLTPEDFATRLRRAPAMQARLGALLVRGTVQRQLYQDAFPELVRVFGLEKGAAADSVVLAAATTPFEAIKGPVPALAYAPDGRSVVLAEGRVVRLWDAGGAREERAFEGHADEVLCVARSADNRFVVSGSRDRTLRLWDAATGKELRRLVGHTDAVRCLTLSSDGQRLLSGGTDRTIRLWALPSGEELACWTGHDGPVTAVALSGDGRLALSCGLDRTVRLWDVGTGKERGRWTGHAAEVFAVAFAPDGKRALSGGGDGSVLVWDVATGREIGRLEGPRNAVVCVAFQADGQQVLSGCSQYRGSERVVRLWDLATGRAVASWGEELVAGAITFRPDGTTALLGHAGGVRVVGLSR